MRLQCGSECRREQAGALLLQLQSDMTKSPGDGEQFIHSQQQTFNYQIKPIALYYRMENHHHLLNVERQ